MVTACEIIPLYRLYTAIIPFVTYILAHKTFLAMAKRWLKYSVLGGLGISTYLYVSDDFGGITHRAKKLFGAKTPASEKAKVVVLGTG